MISSSEPLRRGPSSTYRPPAAALRNNRRRRALALGTKKTPQKGGRARALLLATHKGEDLAESKHPESEHVLAGLDWLEADEGNL